MDDEDLMRELVAALLDDTTHQLSLLAQAIQAGDSQLCIRLAHYSKGACANVGATRAAAMLKAIERDAADARFHDCNQSLTALSQEMELLRSEAVAL